MPTHTLSATIANINGQPREGYQVDVVNGETFSAITDASGVFVLDLEPGDYRMPFDGAVKIDGIAYSASAVFRITIPDGEGSVSLAEVTVGVDDASLVALLGRIEALEAAAAIASPAPSMPVALEGQAP